MQQSNNTVSESTLKKVDSFKAYTIAFYRELLAFITEKKLRFAILFTISITSYQDCTV